MNRSMRVLLVVVVALLVVGGIYVALRRPAVSPAGTPLTVYYTKTDGTTLATWTITMRPAAPGESAAAYRAARVLYAAVQVVAGPPANVDAIRFPSGTRALGATVSGTTAEVNLSGDVAHTGGGSFGEDGEFKSLVYTMTSLPNITAVKITIDGKTVATLPGGHLELDQPLHRTDW